MESNKAESHCVQAVVPQDCEVSYLHLKSYLSHSDNEDYDDNVFEES